MFTVQRATSSHTLGSRRVPLYLALFTYGAMAVAIAALWLLYLSQQPDFVRDATQRDFIDLYVGGRTLLLGQGSHLYDPTLQAQLENAAIAPYGPYYIENVYPPWNAVLMMPLALLPYGPAYWLFGLLNLVVVAFTIRLLLDLVVPAAGEKPVLILAALGFAPLFHSFWQGQSTIITLLGLTAAVVMFRRGADRAAGLWLLLVLLKIQLIPLAIAALLIWRRPRAIITFAAGSIAVTGLSVLALGNWLPSNSALIREAMDFVDREGYASAMANWSGLINVLLGTNTGLLAQGLGAVLNAISLVVLAWLCWPFARGDEADRQIRFAPAAILLLLLSPHLYIHDVVVLLLPGFLLWKASTVALAEQADPRLHALRWILGLGPVAFYLMQFWHPPLFQIGAWYLVILLLAVFWAKPLLGRRVVVTTPAGLVVNAPGDRVV